MTEAARAAQKLLVGPWAHLFPYTSPTSTGTGDIDFGPAALVDLHQIQLRWFDHWLKGIDTGLLEEPPVRIFVMGENRWRDEWEWPLARTRYTPYYLRGQGAANTARGDGTLSPQAPGDEPADYFVYDPADPVPTRGGNTLILAMGVQDQRPVEARDDVLVYTSAPMTAPLEVTGPVVVTLHAASTAPDTDFTAKLCDVRPDGFVQNLADGIARGRYRGSRTMPTPLTRDEVSAFTIDLWATSHVFLPGHRLRLEISSSNFPRFDRNLNTGGDQATTAVWQTARQTVFHDHRYPSHVLLPVIPRCGAASGDASGRVVVLELDLRDVRGDALHGRAQHRAQHVVGDQALLAGVGAVSDAHDHHAVGADRVDGDVEPVGVESGTELVQHGVQGLSHACLLLAGFARRRRYAGRCSMKRASSCMSWSKNANTGIARYIPRLRNWSMTSGFSSRRKMRISMSGRVSTSRATNGTWASDVPHQSSVITSSLPAGPSRSSTCASSGRTVAASRARTKRSRFVSIRSRYWRRVRPCANRSRVITAPPSGAALRLPYHAGPSRGPTHDDRGDRRMTIAGTDA
jgi:hypothetical protein